jgi:RND family efflux transporter MFP subunit
MQNTANTRSISRIVTVAPALGLIVLGTTGCLGAKADNSGSATPANRTGARVQTVTVKKQDLARIIELPGTVEGFETADLYAKVGGYLSEISVDIGDSVDADQVLARLAIPEMHNEFDEKEAAVTSAQAATELAQAALDQTRTELQEREFQLEFRLAEFERVRGLVERGSLNSKLLDEATYQRDAARAAVDATQAHIRTAAAAIKAAKAKVTLAEAERDKAETMLRYTEIRAPFDGVVTRRFFDRGAFIQPALGNSAAKPLLTLAHIKTVRVFVDLPMPEVRWLNRGDKVVLDRINALPGEKFVGEVTRFSTALDPTSRMMRVEVDLENPEHRLLPGYYGYVTLLLDEFPQTPVIPSSALMAGPNETFVYCLEGDVCRKRVVITNYQDGTIVGIGMGLHGGEQIVQAGAGQLADGQKVVATNPNSGT